MMRVCFLFIVFILLFWLKFVCWFCRYIIFCNRDCSFRWFSSLILSWLFRSNVVRVTYRVCMWLLCISFWEFYHLIRYAFYVFVCMEVFFLVLAVVVFSYIILSNSVNLWVGVMATDWISVCNCPFKNLVWIGLR